MLEVYFIYLITNILLFLSMMNTEYIEENVRN